MGTAKRDRQRANRQQRLEELAKEARKTKSKRWGLRIGIAVPAAIVVLFLIARLGGSDDDNGSDTVVSTPTTLVGGSTTVDPNASTTSAGETTTTVAESTTTVALAPFVYGKGGCPASDGTSIKQATFTQAFKQCIDPSKNYTATFDTSEGTIVVDLNTADVPGTVNNFVSLSRFHYYDGSLIFRADPSIDIIQGGGKTNSDTPGYTIPDEKNGFTYSDGDLVMARTQSPDSAGGQWFFVGGPNATALDAQGTYVTFGHVTEGLDIVKQILALAGGGTDGQTPTKTVNVNSVTITER